MNIEVIPVSEIEPRFFSGGYSTMTAVISIDTSLPMNYQKETIIHEIIEVFTPSLPHEKVAELTGYILDGLNRLEDING